MTATPPGARAAPPVASATASSCHTNAEEFEAAMAGVGGSLNSTQAAASSDDTGAASKGKTSVSGDATGEQSPPVETAHAQPVWVVTPPVPQASSSSAEPTEAGATADSGELAVETVPAGQTATTSVFGNSADDAVVSDHDSAARAGTAEGAKATPARERSSLRPTAADSGDDSSTSELAAVTVTGQTATWRTTATDTGTGSATSGVPARSSSDAPLGSATASEPTATRSGAMSPQVPAASSSAGPAGSVSSLPAESRATQPAPPTPLSGSPLDAARAQEKMANTATRPSGMESVTVQAGPAVPLAPTVSAPAPAPAAAPPQPPAPPLTAQLARPIVTVASAAAGTQTISVHVAPEALGPVTVHAQVGSGGVRIELFAPNDAARDAIRAILPDLRRDLAGAAQGATLTLSQHDEPSGQQQGQHAAQQQGFGGRHQTSTGAEPRSGGPSSEASIDDAPGPPPDRPTRHTASTIDLLA